MKSIRTFILIAIGMLAFTGTAHTTANLEQKQKVDLVSGFDIQKDYSQVVGVFKEVQISQEISAVQSRVVNLKKVVNSLTISQDVGWRSSQTIINTIHKEKLPLNYLRNNIASRTDKNIVRCRNNC